MVEEQDMENTFFPTNKLKNHLRGEQLHTEHLLNIFRLLERQTNLTGVRQSNRQRLKGRQRISG